MAQDEYKPLRIEDLPRNLQPRELLKCVDPRHSSDDTLLSIILRVGVPGANVVETSRRLLAAFGSLDQLANASYEELELASVAAERRSKSRMPPPQEKLDELRENRVQKAHAPIELFN